MMSNFLPKVFSETTDFQSWHNIISLYKDRTQNTLKIMPLPTQLFFNVLQNQLNK